MRNHVRNILQFEAMNNNLNLIIATKKFTGLSLSNYLSIPENDFFNLFKFFRIKIFD